jgi:putative ABC transport system permease protein
MKSLLQDLRYAIRVLAKNPGFAAVAVLTLALGIGANSAIFSLVDAILLRPLPYPDPNQLVGLGQWRNQAGQGYLQTGVSAPNIADIARSGVFRYVAYYRFSNFNITEGDRPEAVSGIKGSSDLLPLFGVPPMMGRFLKPEESEEGRDQVAVIGHRLWQVRFGADPAILGKTVDLDRRRYTIVGVMPETFRFTWDQEMDVFVPLVLTPEERGEAGRGTSRDLQTQARINPGIGVRQAQAAMDRLADTLAEKYPAANRGWGIKVEPLHAAYHRQIRTPLLIMLGAVLFVLLIACVNVANLLLARATGRKREVAIRVAIGATRGRLVAQLLTESLLLAGCGGAFGLLLAYAGDRLLTVAMAAARLSFPNARTIEIDWRVLLFSLAITVLTGAVFGLAPSLVATKTGLSDALKEGGLSTTAEAARRRLRNGLVVAEIALALVLLAGAGLLVRTFVELASVDLGIDPHNVVAMGVRLPAYKYPSAQRQAVFFRDLLQKIEAAPGIVAAGAQGGGGSIFFQPEGQAPAAPGQEPTASYKFVTPRFLDAMGTRLVSGRAFTERDDAAAPLVAIVSEAVVRRYWPHSNPLGGHLTVMARVYSGERSASKPVEIVGVAKDVRNDNLWRPEPAIYVPMAQKPVSGVFLVARTGGPPMSAVPAIRDAVRSLDKEQPVNNVRTMDEVVSRTYGAIRFPMALLWIFAALALVLSAVGIFGVMSYTVSRRTQEIAIRIALGAGRAEVLRLVLREGLAVTAAGVAVGLAGSLALSRVMSGYVYGVTATDPVTFVAASLILTLVALVASYLPAVRASKVDPIVALRCE